MSDPAFRDVSSGYGFDATRTRFSTGSPELPPGSETRMMSRRRFTLLSNLPVNRLIPLGSPVFGVSDVNMGDGAACFVHSDSFLFDCRGVIGRSVTCWECG